MKQVLKLACEPDAPDLRDRGFVSWRLISADLEAAKEVVLSNKESIDDSSSKHDGNLLDELLMHIASLASVYHKPPSSFLPDYLNMPVKKVMYMEDEDEEEEVDEGDSSQPVEGHPHL